MAMWKKQVSADKTHVLLEGETGEVRKLLTLKGKERKYRRDIRTGNLTDIDGKTKGPLREGTRNYMLGYVNRVEDERIAYNSKNGRENHALNNRMSRLSTRREYFRISNELLAQNFPGKSYRDLSKKQKEILKQAVYETKDWKAITASKKRG